MTGKIVVTGGAGFIGSAFVSRLNKEGISNIVIVDTLRSGEKWRNLINLRYEDFIQKDTFINAVITESLPFEVLAIVHMGACSSTTERDADYLMQNNFQYTKTLAQYCLKHKLRFIYASSAATYGLGEAGYDDDISKLRTLRPLNMYGYSKHLFDLWAAEHGVLDRMVGLKFFNVFGPNEYHKEDMRSMVFKAYEQIEFSGSVRLFRSADPKYKDGGQMRDFVYVKDCVEAMLWLLNNPQVNGIYNIGFGAPRTWNDLVTAVFKALNKKVQIDYIDMPESLRKQYQYFTEANISRLKGAGYTKPFTSLEDAVSDYIKNYLLTSNRWY